MESFKEYLISEYKDKAKGFVATEFKFLHSTNLKLDRKSSRYIKIDTIKVTVKFFDKNLKLLHTGTNQVAEFVDLLNHPNYEILNIYPFTIRRKDNHYIVKESLNERGYLCLNLADNDKRHTCRKHRLIAEQFLPNPNNLPEIDHVNHLRTDNHLENLRWISRSDNNRNKASYKGVRAHYVETIPDDAVAVDFYETRTETHYFENYYYHEGNFYYDNDANYRVLNINTIGGGARFVSMLDINGRSVSVYINRFLEQHDLD